MFSYKVQGLEFLHLAERMFLLDHYINFCQAHILYLTAKAEEMERRSAEETLNLNPARLTTTLNLIQHSADQWRLELEWVNRLREQEQGKDYSDKSSP